MELFPEDRLFVSILFAILPVTSIIEIEINFSLPILKLKETIDEKGLGKIVAAKSE